MPSEGFLPEDGRDIDNAPLTMAVSCLMSYERTGICAFPTCSSHELNPTMTLQQQAGDSAIGCAQRAVDEWQSAHYALEGS